MTPLRIYEAFAFLLGLLFGSFLNVCISRLPKHESVMRPRSRCPNCGAPIRWYDNIPILSWILLRGRCRDCKQPISWRYPLVELAVGWFFWICVNTYSSGLGRSHNFGGSFSDADLTALIVTIGIAILGFLLIGLMVMDWQTHLLPDAFTLTGIAIGFFLVCAQTVFLGPHQGEVLLDTTRQLRMSSPGSSAGTGNVFLTGAEALIGGRLAAIAGVALMLLLIRWLYQLFRHREGLGLGDIKLIAMIAAFLGFWPAILSLFLGVLAATAYALLLLLRGRANRLTRLPFGSFIAAGGLVASLYGNSLINIYTTMLR